MELILPLARHALRTYDSGHCWPFSSGPLLNDGGASLLLASGYRSQSRPGLLTLSDPTSFANI